MTKFNQTSTSTAPGRGPIVAETSPSTTTAEGGAGYLRDAQSELFLLAVSNMVGESTFYETSAGRDSRYAQLIATVAVTDPEWMGGFLGWLRTAGNMRTASLVGGLEAARAMLAAKTPGARQVIASVLQRADEPGEALAYWTSHYGRGVPKPIKRAIADAARRLYTDRNILKYDTASHGYRFGDVLDLTHPAPGTPEQGTWFRHALDRRHNRDTAPPEGMLTRNAMLRSAVATGELGGLLNPDTLRLAGMTWEDALSLAGSKVDKAQLWEAMIPSMGYMALLRNLRNFDESGVSDQVAATVAAKLADPAEVSRSRQLPMRFLSAHRAAPSLRWSYPLEQALGHCLESIPPLGGRTLILIDTSGSMNEGFSKDGTLKRWDAAVLFGVALALRCAHADVISFSNAVSKFQPHRGESLLKALERWRSEGHFHNGGTYTEQAVRATFKNHDRVVIVTDEQDSWGGDPSRAVPSTVPLYTWNLAGYRIGSTPTGPYRHTFGGLTDAAFRMIPLIEAGRTAAWPWTS